MALRWHRHRVAGWRLSWYWGTHGDYGYGWRWFRRSQGARPPAWRGCFGPLYVNVMAPHKGSGKG